MRREQSRALRIREYIWEVFFFNTGLIKEVMYEEKNALYIYPVQLGGWGVVARSVYLDGPRPCLLLRGCLVV